MFWMVPGIWKPLIYSFNSIPKRQEKKRFHLSKIQRSQSGPIVIISFEPHNIPQRQARILSPIAQAGKQAWPRWRAGVQLLVLRVFPREVKWFRIWHFLSPHLPSPHCRLDGSILWNMWTQSNLIFSISSTFLKIKIGISSTPVEVSVAKRRNFKVFPLNRAFWHTEASTWPTAWQSQRHQSHSSIWSGSLSHSLLGWGWAGQEMSKLFIFESGKCHSFQCLNSHPVA